MSLADMDMSRFKKEATYEAIKDYVKEQTGYKVSSLYIAQVKAKRLFPWKARLDFYVCNVSF